MKRQQAIERLPAIANLVLIALIALSLAHLFWLIWPKPPIQAIAPSDAQQDARSANQNSVDAGAIAGAHLFGKQQVVDADIEKQKELNAPETHLNLELTGIIADSQQNGSRALVKNADGKQQSYRIGQAIVSGVVLHAIFPQKVILDRNGHFETLTLESIKKMESMAGFERPSMGASTSSADGYPPPGTPSSAGSGHGSSAGQSSTSGTASTSSTRTVSGAVAQQLSEIRRRIMADPSSAQRYIRLQPARQDGNLVGYRIFPGRDKALFEKAGLKSGDIVTAINGQSLDNTSASLRMLSGLARAGSATITVRGNNGQTRNVRVNFQ